MDDMAFGDILRETRERKGLDLNATARRLRIRPDILRAIEDGNFAAMPPRGYTRNMVNGYARFLGLNSTEITGMYLSALADYQARVNSSRRRSTGFDMSEAPENTRFRTTRMRPTNGNRNGRSSRRGESYADGLQSMERSRGIAGGGRTVYPESRMHQSRGSVLPASSFIDQRGSDRLYIGETIVSKLPYVAAAVVVLVIVIALTSALFGGCSRKEETVETMPVTGLSDETEQVATTVNDANTMTSQQTPAQQPTEGVFEITVADGKNTYVEVYVDGAVAFADEDGITGPAVKTFTFKESLQFICTDISALTATLAGAPVTLTENEGGVCNQTFTFADALAAWKSANPGATVTLPEGTGASGSESSQTGQADANAASADNAQGAEDDGASDDYDDESYEGDEYDDYDEDYE